MKEPKVIVGSGGRTEAGSGNTAMLMRCPKLYQYAEVRGLRLPQVQVPSHFTVGLLFAAMRREWFKQKFDASEETWKLMKMAAKKEAAGNKLPMNPKDMLYAINLMGQYVEHWLKRPRPRPVAAEYKLGPCPIKAGDEHTKRTARLDDLSYYPEAGGALCVGEAKTTSGDIGSVIREYELHVQPMQYVALYMASKRGEQRFGPIAGVVLDVTRKDYEGKKSDFARVFIEVRKDAVAQFVESAAYFTRIAERIQWDTPVMRTYQCTYMAGRAKVDCMYKPICRFGKSSAGSFVLQDGSSLRSYEPKPGAEKMPWE